MRKMFRVSTLLSVLLAVVAGAALFMVSQYVQQSESKKASLEKFIIYEEKSQQVLRAEWDYLNNPARLEKLTAEYLDLVSPDVKHVVDNGQLLPDRVSPAIPLRKPLMKAENVAYQAAPEMVYSSSKTRDYLAPRPPQKPLYHREKTNFQNLIETLSKEGGE